MVDGYTSGIVYTTTTNSREGWLDSMDGEVAAPTDTAYPAMMKHMYSHLPVVDIWKDPHVWAIPDGGCNSSCHSKAWRINTQKKLANMGSGYAGIYKNDPTIKSFSGLGSMKSTSRGVFRYPTCYRTWNPAKEKYETEAGELETCEIEEGSSPLLIGTDIMYQLGISVDYAEGKVYQYTTLEPYGEKVA